ncbi:MAG TPA: hypothetical protein PLZ36_04435 [Armatimonadota bacterium]|nr:hypothetical protein [Armatimonadota bacterium]HOS44346.1 hypothetical protein [Armatimonadota bacterium]
MSTKGVTLTEALLIVAILAMLVVVFYPVFAPRRGHGSRQVTCMNNQRQLSLAVMVYAQDNDETFFPDPGSTAWTRSLSVDDKSCDCPTLAGKGRAAHPEYGFNANLFGKRIRDIPQPAATLLTADLRPSGMFTSYPLTSATPADAHDFDDDIDPRHRGGFVYTCVDGHVAYAPVTHGETVRQVLHHQGVCLHPAGAPQPPARTPTDTPATR